MYDKVVTWGCTRHSSYLHVIKYKTNSHFLTWKGTGASAYVRKNCTRAGDHHLVGKHSGRHNRMGPLACIPIVFFLHHLSHHVVGNSAWVHTLIGIHSTLFLWYNNNIHICTCSPIASPPLFHQSPEHTVAVVYNNAFSVGCQCTKK